MYQCELHCDIGVIIIELSAIQFLSLAVPNISRM